MTKHHTGSLHIKRSRNGTTIRATGSAAQALFDAVVSQAEAATRCQARIEPVEVESQPAADAATMKGR